MTLYAGYRHSRFGFEPSRARVWRVIAEHLQRYVPEGGAVLDLGSGYCDFINSINASKKWAVDLHLDPGEFAGEDVHALKTCVADLAGVPDGSLDLVFASNLLEHLSDELLLATLPEVRRKLRAGGRFIAIQPNFAHCHRQYFDDYTHVKVFTHVSLADFVRSQGFVVERMVPRFLPFSMKSRAPKWPWLVRLYLRLPWKPGAKQMLLVARKTGD